MRVPQLTCGATMGHGLQLATGRDILAMGREPPFGRRSSLSLLLTEVRRRASDGGLAADGALFASQLFELIVSLRVRSTRLIRVRLRRRNQTGTDRRCVGADRAREGRRSPKRRKVIAYVIAGGGWDRRAPSANLLILLVEPKGIGSRAARPSGRGATTENVRRHQGGAKRGAGGAEGNRTLDLLNAILGSAL